MKKKPKQTPLKSNIVKYIEQTNEAPEHGITRKEDFDYYYLEYYRNWKETIPLHLYTKSMELQYYLNLMHVAVDNGDERWFNELARKYMKVKQYYENYDEDYEI